MARSWHTTAADTPTTLEPARFVRSLAGMLAARLEGYAAMLENPGIKDALERVDSDPASAFEAAVLSPLHSVPKTAGDRRYLLIDALDEALMHPKRPTIVEVLAARINRLPPWLGIVATTRSELGVLSQLRGLPAQALKADDPKNQDDVRAFLKGRLNEPRLRTKVEASGKTFEEVAEGLLRSSAGNFLFVTTAIDAVQSGQLRFDDIENQPPGRLSSLYEVFFNRLFRDAGMDFQPADQVLEVVAAAREPLTRKQIAAVTGLDGEKELPPLFGRLAAFVPKQHMAAIRMMFSWLTEKGILAINPAREVKTPKFSRTEGKTPAFSTEEVQKVLASIDTSHVVGHRDKAFLATLAYTFARIGAVVNLKVEDYFQAGKRSLIRFKEKGGKEKEIPVHHKLEKILDEYLKVSKLREKPDTPLFPTTLGKSRELGSRPMTRFDGANLLKRRLRDAGIVGDYSPHSFRATGITNYLENGGTLEVAQRIAGHADSRTTKLYDRRGQKVLLEDMERIRY